MKSSKHTGRKKQYLAPDTVELEYDEFSPSAPNFSTGTIPLQYRETSHYLRHSGGVQEDDVAPSAPPLDHMDQVYGYETTSFDAVCVPPPPSLSEWEEDQQLQLEQQKSQADGEKKEQQCEQQMAQGDAAGGCSGTGPTSPTRLQIADLPPVSEVDARNALLGMVTEHCCWGRAAARHMSIGKILSSSAFHYEIQTFTEKRETSWAFMPHGGGEVDGPRCGPAPRPWDIPADPTDLFRSEMKVLQVPHTASVKTCHRCRGAGSLLCQECHGKGWTRCLSCHGDGWGSDSAGNKERCFFCQSSTHGRGRQDCLKCNAKGRVACPPCDSYGQIRCYISLTITWKANTSEHIVAKSSLPEDLIRQVSGQVVYEEEGPRITPLHHFTDPTISLASTQLVLNHNRQWPDQRILAQRQQVRMVPVTEVHYTWKRRTGKFYLYGYEHKVHAPDYPQTCCWGCSIL
ncbi:protein SSUH2 homolog isoform X2 [Daphnia carinata]|uniref:protein SSUH2 homolog isoform X2 n=1 Tax=Daphnia carinata TaxID=120202 RepID=UPI00257E5783|nr:protein SSUH2 homolog isoform X2 [Daphnia carinata]XP_057376318.1 protein SSUH2 homolog isoform X2 [Daphnia carinata]